MVRVGLSAELVKLLVRNSSLFARVVRIKINLHLVNWKLPVF